MTEDDVAKLSTARRAARSTEALREVLHCGRNGASAFYRHFGRLRYSDGARDAAQASQSYWLFDLLAAEVAPLMIRKINAGELGIAVVNVNVSNSKALVEVVCHADLPPLWRKEVSWTDFPEGEWSLYELGALEFDGEACISIAAVLRSEQ